MLNWAESVYDTKNVTNKIYPDIEIRIVRNHGHFWPCALGLILPLLSLYATLKRLTVSVTNFFIFVSIDRLRKRQNAFKATITIMASDKTFHSHLHIAFYVYGCIYDVRYLPSVRDIACTLHAPLYSNFFLHWSRLDIYVFFPRHVCLFVFFVNFD